MKLARFASGSHVSLGVVDGEELVDVGTELSPDPLEFLSGGRASFDAAEDVMRRGAGHRQALSDVRLLAPISRPPKFLAIGLNYEAHLTETGRERPETPIFFNKQSTCVIGPGEAIQVPTASSYVDYEGELGVVIGTRCRHVEAADWQSVVAGFLVVNDVSVRDWQIASPTMTMGKSFDTHGPIGPWIVTGDELGDASDLRLTTTVNGEVLQDASTAEMLYGIGEQIEHLSTAFTLEVGDVIATGTPAGVGAARQPPIWLRAGDVVRIEIEGIGALENPVVDEPLA